MTNPAPLAEALLITTPPMAAALIAGVVFNASLADAPALWINLIGGAAVGVTTLAAAAESARAPEPDDPGVLIWPLLLIWPLAFPWYMNRRHRLGSGLAGAALLIGALGWGLHHVEQARDALGAVSAAALAPHTAISEAERMRILRARIEAQLDAEDAAAAR